MASAPKRGDKSSGFVVKLYQMVNGAPDDICSVSVEIMIEQVADVIYVLFNTTSNYRKSVDSRWRILPHH
eukprot:scaffold42466_cov42-Cyclotella_meneghiniana.AAC.2